MRVRLGHIFISLLICQTVVAHDTVYVSGALQHDGLLEWTQKTAYKSNSYADLSVHYENDSNKVHFRSLRVTTRAELTQWPLPGYEADFGGHGIGHLSAAAAFDWGEVTVGDVYGQFGSGLVLSLYEDRALGIDGALRGGKIELYRVQGLHVTLLGGKQRRYWSCYKDHAWGWKYTRDAALGGDVEVDISQWSKWMREHEMELLFGGSYVSKYEALDTVIVPMEGSLMMYNLPRWVGAGDIRTHWQMKGWDVLVEYARKANDPTEENGFNYRDGECLLVSAGYSKKGLSVLVQAKRSDNMSFRSERLRTGLAGRLNHMPAFARQHTYALPSLYPYATQYAGGEWAFQTEVLWTARRKSTMGGRYGTTLGLGASHIRGLKHEGSWAIDTRSEGEYYTDVHVEMNKRLTSRWWLNGMLMYQGYNRTIVEGEGGLVRSGIAVVDTHVQAHPNVSVRGELQYLYSRDYEGQWCFALVELGLYKQLTISGQWLYNIGGTEEATHAHYYTVAAVWSHKAHRLTAGYTKTREGFNCSGGVCRYVPRQEGVTLSYNFVW